MKFLRFKVYKMSDLNEKWQKIKCGEKIFFVDFDFHNHFNHKRKTGRFNFQQPLFSFLAKENKGFEENKKWKLYLSLNLCDKEPFFEFDETTRKLSINYPKFKESCEKSRSSNNNDAKIFFGKDLNLRAALKTQSSDKKQEIILENLDEETVLKWWDNLTEELRVDFLHKINTDFDFSKISDLEILTELKKRNLNKKDFFEFAVNFLSTKEKLKIEDLQRLTKTIDFKKIDNVLKEWEKNKKNNEEVQFWQPFFKDNQWIISQVFSSPFTFFDNEFYVGGLCSGSRKGSKNTDFGYKNKFSQNVAIIEIKTPMTDLVEKKLYDNRAKIYPMSKKLMGSISQILNQKDNLQKDFLHNNKQKDFEVWNPKAILIIGSEENERLNSDQRACFELFKNSQKDIEIVTFDELFEKIKNLSKLYTND